jgi:hypothetical protein
MMTKEQLHDLAAAGVANRVKDIERELAEYHREWPTLFLSATPPQLLAAAKKAAHQNGNGSGAWPVSATAPSPSIAARIVTYLQQQSPATTHDLQHATDSSDSGFNRAIRQLVESGSAVQKDHGVYALGTGEVPSRKWSKTRHRRTRSQWTPAMRKAQAARMRAMHKDGTIAKAKRAKAKT